MQTARLVSIADAASGTGKIQNDLSSSICILLRRCNLHARRMCVAHPYRLWPGQNTAAAVAAITASSVEVLAPDTDVPVHHRNSR